jgi:hypothetical protein
MQASSVRSAAFGAATQSGRTSGDMGRRAGSWGLPLRRVRLAKLGKMLAYLIGEHDGE